MTDFPTRGQKRPQFWDAQLQAYIDETPERELGDTYQRVFTPEAYGAVADGVTDDTAAFQAAITAAMQSGGIVQMQSDKIYAATQLVVDYSTLPAQAASGAPYGYRGIVIKGGYRGSQLKQLNTAGLGQDFFVVKGRTGVDAGPGSNNKVTGFVLQQVELIGLYTGGPNGNPSSTKGGSGLSVQSVFDSEFRNIVIRNFPSNGVEIKRTYFQSGVADEYAYDLRFSGVRSLVNGGYGFSGGNNAGSAVSAKFDVCDATSNRLGGFLSCPANAYFSNCIAINNKVFGFRTVPTNQSPGGSQDVSVAAGATFVACRSENTSGFAEFDLQGSQGVSLFGCQTFATGGAHCIATGAGQTGVTIHRPFVFGGYYSGDGASVGQMFLTMFPGGLLATALTSGVAVTSLTLKAPATIPNGTVLTLDNGTNTATVTVSSAVSNSVTVPISSFTPSNTYPVGSGALALSITDAQNPGAQGVRIDYTTFAGNRLTPNALIRANNMQWMDPQNLIFNPAGWIEFARQINTPGNASAGRMIEYIKTLSTGVGALAVKFPTGGEQIIAYEDGDAATARLLTGANSGNNLSTGQEALARDLATSSVGMTSGLVRMRFFTARKTETVNNIAAAVAGTGAAATPTLCRMGIYSVAANGDLTLEGACANDTALFANANTIYTRSLTAPVSLVAGKRYVFAALVITATTVPLLTSSPAGSAAAMALAPRLTASLSGQTDLPSSIASASLATSSTGIYGAVTP